ncbi:hypothetical protein LINPERPRIM_LOCUS24998 [Linum perenne]
MCAFSDGGRLLESHHSKLHFITVEFMLCTRNWVNDELKIGLKMAAKALEGCFTGLHIIMAMGNEDENIDESMTTICTFRKLFEP